jgi:UDP-2,3-diacylglucosamine hydrolase
MAMAHGLVLSDLHLFRQFSQGDQRLEHLLRLMRPPDFLVLNGDIFDFNWSVLPSVEATVEAGIRRLSELIHQLPGCRIHYILGNHDCGQSWADRLESESASLGASFHWHPAMLRLDDCLFWHGDLPLFRPDRDPFQRFLPKESRRRGRISRAIHALSMRINLHRLAYRLFPPAHCAQAMLFALQRHHPEVLPHIHRIFFGHTHNPFHRFSRQGITFANSGAALSGVKLLPLPVSIRQECLLSER